MSGCACIGVAIATRNRRADVLTTVARLRGLPERPPIVVADNGSGDGTVAALRARWPELQVLSLGVNRGGAARTDAARVLGTPYVAFSDDDSWWAPGALVQAVALLAAHPQVGLLAARVLVGPARRLDATCAAMAASPLSDGAGVTAPGTPVLGFVACGAVVRRSAFLGVGGFDARYGIGGEERLLATDLAAAGWQLRYVPELIAYHWPQPSGDRAGRDAHVVRNDLWSAWLRRPARRLPGATLRVLAAGGAAWPTLRGASAALRGLAWIVRERRPLPPHVEAAVRTLERA